MKKRIFPRADFSRRVLKRANKDPNVTVICDTFCGVNWFEKVKVFPIFTVYFSPKDFPGKYVVRLFDADKPLRLITVSDTLEQARATIPQGPPLGFAHMTRSPEDDPVIVETWL